MWAFYALLYNLDYIITGIIPIVNMQIGIIPVKKGILFIMSKSVLENLAKVHIGRQELINNGFSAQKYDDVQRGKSSYKLLDIIAMSEKFQLSLDFLVYGKEKSSSSELTKEELEVLEKFNKLLDIDKGRILDRMESIFESYSPEQKENVS